MIHNICWTFFHFDLIIDSSKIILTYQNIFEKKDKRKVTDINLANIYTQFLVFLKKNLSIISSNFRKKNKMLRRTNMKIKALKKVQMSSKSFLCFFGIQIICEAYIWTKLVIVKNLFRIFPARCAFWDHPVQMSNWAFNYYPQKEKKKATG